MPIDEFLMSMASIYRPFHGIIVDTLLMTLMISNICLAIQPALIRTQGKKILVLQPRIGTSMTTFYEYETYNLNTH